MSERPIETSPEHEPRVLWFHRPSLVLAITPPGAETIICTERPVEPELLADEATPLEEIGIALQADEPRVVVAPALTNKVRRAYTRVAKRSNVPCYALLADFTETECLAIQEFTGRRIEPKEWTKLWNGYQRTRERFIRQAGAYQREGFAGVNFLDRPQASLFPPIGFR